jgi:nucleotide-binding universal stress UspA family protein
MGLKDLLVYVDSDLACDSRVDVAASLAVKHEAHLTGLHAMGWPRFPGYVEAELSPNFLDEQRRLLGEWACQAEKRFLERARWRGVEEGDVVGTVKLHARYADLTVVGQGLDLKDAPETWRSCLRSWPSVWDGRCW